MDLPIMLPNMQFHMTEFYISDIALTTQNQIGQLLLYCYNAYFVTGVFFPLLEQMLLQSQNKPGSVMGKGTQRPIKSVLLGT